MNSYTIASYLRISADNGDSAENESIIGQRALISEYIRTHQDFKDAKHLEFCDEGYSGTNFNRPAVQELISKIKNGEANCIIVKDFSRFGRNYIEVSDYLEQIFPFLQVRFISINDNYDSAINKYPAGNMSIAFKNLYNDYYCKDISRKVKSSVNMLRESGKYLSSYEIYGYEKSKESKYKLVVDEKAATVVRRIFDMAVSGKNTSEIAAKLNTDGVLSPMAYKQSKGIKRNWKTLHDRTVWTGTTVYRIVKDIRYTGAVVHGMYQVLSVGSDRSRTLPREQWQIHYNQHEPIISNELYEEAQNRLKKYGAYHAAKRSENKTTAPTPLSSVKIRCGGCGYAMSKRYRDGILYCKQKHYINDNRCVKESIRIEVIENTVLAAVQNLLSVYSSQHEIVRKNKQLPSADLLSELSKLHKEIERVNNMKLDIYKSYSDGDITHEQYLNERETANNQIEQLLSQVSVLENEYDQTQNNISIPSPVAEIFCNRKIIERLTPEIVSALIDTIYIYDTDKIEIKWKFAETGIMKLS